MKLNLDYKTSFHITLSTFLLLCFTITFLNKPYLSTNQTAISNFLQPLRVSTRSSNQENAIGRQRLDPNCTNRYIYMHDLPPRFNQDLLRNCHTLKENFDYCPFFQNNGFGAKLNWENWYDTNQYTLSIIFHSRMKQYECLTSNSSLASAIYAPFYPGLQVSPYFYNKSSSSIKDAGALDFVSWLREKPEWNVMMGKYHFFVLGRISWDFNRASDHVHKWGNKLLRLPESKNMTVLSIETNYPNENEFAIPYPTYFHPSTDRDVLDWQERVGTASNRSYLSVFAGAPRPHKRQSIQGKLIDQCTRAKNNSCILVHCAQNSDLCSIPTHIIEVYEV